MERLEINDWNDLNPRDTKRLERLEPLEPVDLFVQYKTELCTSLSTRQFCRCSPNGSANYP